MVVWGLGEKDQLQYQEKKLSERLVEEQQKRTYRASHYKSYF